MPDDDVFVTLTIDPSSDAGKGLILALVEKGLTPEQVIAVLIGAAAVACAMSDMKLEDFVRITGNVYPNAQAFVNDQLDAMKDQG